MRDSFLIFSFHFRLFDGVCFQYFRLIIVSLLSKRNYYYHYFIHFRSPGEETWGNGSQQKNRDQPDYSTEYLEESWIPEEIFSHADFSEKLPGKTGEKNSLGV